MDYYYLALNLISLVCLGIVGSEWLRAPRSEGERRLIALAGLTMAQAALTISAQLAGAFWLVVALELVCATFLLGNTIWLDMRNARMVLMFFLGVSASLGAWFAALLVFDHLELWELGRMAVAGLGLALTLRQPQVAQPLRIGTLVALLLGSFLGLLGWANGGRIFVLAAYLFMAAVIYSAVTADLRSYGEELQVISGEALRCTREQFFLLEASEVIGGLAGLGYMLNRVVRSISLAAGADQTVIILLQDGHVSGEAGHEDNGGEKKAVVAARYDVAQPETDDSRLPFNTENYPLLEQTVFRRQQVVLDVGQHPAATSLLDLWDGSPDGPLLMLPLALKEKVLGALIVANPRSGRPFDERDVRLCQSLATQVAVAVENVRLYQTLTEQAEQLARLLELREAEASQSQAILESIADGVVVSNAQGQVVLVNAAAERILEVPRRQLLDRPIGTVYGRFTSDEPVEKLATELSIGHEPLPTFVEREGRVVRGMLSPVRTPEGVWLGLVAVFRDVTREAEADWAKDEFISTVSRELRTPLTAIKGYAELLVEAADTAPSQLRFLEVIRASADRMAEVIDNVTFIAGVERDTVQLGLQEIDVVELVEEALAAISPLATARQLALKMELAPDLPCLEADRPRLRLVLDNLLSNACRFTGPGGRVMVRAWVQQDVAARSGSGYMIIAVADTGVGIPPEEQSRIFERFYRADNPLQMEAGGMGVGLSVVKELVEAHGGRVWVESHVGQGSIFHVALPLGQSRSLARLSQR
jgi:PAS domain S-box-containing protein